MEEYAYKDHGVGVSNLVGSLSIKTAFGRYLEPIVFLCSQMRFLEIIQTPSQCNFFKIFLVKSLLKLTTMSSRLNLGKIYDRKLLWPIVQQKLERQQFNALDEADKAKYQEYFVLNESLKTPDQHKTDLNRVSRPFGSRGLSFLEVDDIITKELWLSIKTVDFYMGMICNYVNSVRRPLTSGVDQNLNGGEESSERPKSSYQSIEPMNPGETAQQKYLSCRMMTTAQFLQCTTVDRAKKVLEDMDLAGDNFKNLDYLLIGYGNGTRKSRNFGLVLR